MLGGEGGDGVNVSRVVNANNQGRREGRITACSNLVSACNQSGRPEWCQLTVFRFRPLVSGITPEVSEQEDVKEVVCAVSQTFPASQREDGKKNVDQFLKAIDDHITRDLGIAVKNRRGVRFVVRWVRWG